MTPTDTAPIMESPDLSSIKKLIKELRTKTFNTWEEQDEAYSTAIYVIDTYERVIREIADIADTLPCTCTPYIEPMEGGKVSHLCEACDIKHIAETVLPQP